LCQTKEGRSVSTAAMIMIVLQPLKMPVLSFTQKTKSKQKSKTTPKMGKRVQKRRTRRAMEEDREEKGVKERGREKCRDEVVMPAMGMMLWVFCYCWCRSSYSLPWSLDVNKRKGIMQNSKIHQPEKEKKKARTKPTK
jgi:hypothetical protein